MSQPKQQRDTGDLGPEKTVKSGAHDTTTGARLCEPQRIESFFAFYSAICVRRRPKCCGSQSRAPPVRGSVEMRPSNHRPELSA